MLEIPVQTRNFFWITTQHKESPTGTTSQTLLQDYKLVNKNFEALNYKSHLGFVILSKWDWHCGNKVVLVLATLSKTVLIHQICILDLALLNLTLTASTPILIAERNSVSNLHFLVQLFQQINDWTNDF